MGGGIDKGQVQGCVGTSVHSGVCQLGMSNVSTAVEAGPV